MNARLRSESDNCTFFIGELTKNLMTFLSGTGSLYKVPPTDEWSSREATSVFVVDVEDVLFPIHD